MVDPVMLSTSGHSLMSQDAMSTLKNELLPFADVITHNIFETEGLEIKNKEDMLKGAK